MCLDQKSQIYLYVIRAEGNEQGENLGVASSIFFSRFCTHPLHVFHIALLPQRHQCQSGHKSGLLPLPLPPRRVINQVYMHRPVFGICPLGSNALSFELTRYQTKNLNFPAAAVYCHVILDDRTSSIYAVYTFRVFRPSAINSMSQFIEPGIFVWHGKRENY